MQRVAKKAIGFAGFVLLLLLTAIAAIYESFIYVLATPITWFSNNKHSKESIAQQSFVLTPVFFGWANKAADWAGVE